MERQCFEELCLLIEEAIGPSLFKSEHFLNELDKEGVSTPAGRMFQAAKHTSGEYIFHLKSEEECGGVISEPIRGNRTLRYVSKSVTVRGL